MRKTNEQIFAEIELTRDEIIAIVRGDSFPQKPRLIARGKGVRPKCLVCAMPINRFNCKPFRQPKLKDQ